MNYSRIFMNYIYIQEKMKFFIFGENGRVSRSNSGDLAGKCETSNRFQKIAYAENNCSSVF